MTGSKRPLTPLRLLHISRHVKFERGYLLCRTATVECSQDKLVLTNDLYPPKLGTNLMFGEPQPLDDEDLRGKIWKRKITFYDMIV
jgi:hypothetical protein